MYNQKDCYYCYD